MRVEDKALRLSGVYANGLCTGELGIRDPEGSSELLPSTLDEMPPHQSIPLLSRRGLFFSLTRESSEDA